MQSRQRATTFDASALVEDEHDTNEVSETKGPLFRCTVSPIRPSCPAALQEYEKQQQYTAEKQLENKEQPNLETNHQSQQQQQQQKVAELDWSCLKDGQLFGREREIRQLQETFERRLTLAKHNDKHQGGILVSTDISTTVNKSCELTLVSGASGTGKTALVKKALQEVVEVHDGYFLFGKFDQLQAVSEPYRPFVAALTQLAMALEADNNNIPPEQMLEEVGMESCRALCELVPALGRPLGLTQAQQQAFEKAPSHQFEAQQDRIKVAMIKLFKVVCWPSGFSRYQSRKQKIVVIVMDDLQWGDSASLRLLESLVSMDMKGNGTFMALGICRDNEVPWHHSFASMLRRLEDEKNANILHVRVQGLSVQSTNDLLCELLHQTHDICLPLAQMINEKSDQGNSFFMLQLLKALQKEGVLVAEQLLAEVTSGDDIQFQSQFQWLWYDDRWAMLAPQGSLDVVALVSRDILRLPDDCQHLLKTAACIGAEVETSTLVALLCPTLRKSAIRDCLQKCVSEGMMVEQLPHYPGRFSFSHDKVQQSAYSLVLEDDRPMSHIVIGRSLLQHFSSNELDTHLFLVVNQLIQGSSLLTTEIDKNGLAELCARAGKKASRAGDFATARSYFHCGTSLLSRRHWRDQYHVTLELITSQAEAECCSANFEEMDLLVEEIFANCRSYKDKIRAYMTQIYSLGLRTRFDDAICLGLQVLAHLGEKIHKPHMIYILPELLRVQKGLKSKSDDDIFGLPDFDSCNPTRAASMAILNLLSAYCFCASPDYFPLVALRMVKLTLQYGICDTGCLGLAYYGVVLCALGKYQEGHRFGMLGLRLLERCPASKAKFLPRLSFIAKGLIAPWTTQLCACTNQLSSVVPAAIDCGDVECAQFSAHQVVLNLYLGGSKLPVVVSRLEQYKKFMPAESPWLALIMLVQQSTDNLIGKSTDPLSLFLDSEVGPTAGGSKQNFLYYEFNVMTLRLLLAYHFGDIDVALQSARASRVNGKIIKASYVHSFQLFYDGMAVLEAAHNESRWNRRRHIRWAKKIIKKMEVLAVECAANISHMLRLLRGELDVLEGNLVVAIASFTKAKSCATAQGACPLTALAQERSAIAYERLGRGPFDAAQANNCWKEAIQIYSRWGASAIVSRLESKLEHELDPSEPTSINNTE